MRWELYLTRREWEEIKAAVRDRAPKDKHSGKPCCERCKQVNGKLKRTKKGYLVPHWLHTAHTHGAPMKSKNPGDYVALCDGCHMWYDRQPDDSGWVPQYRQGYQATTTGDLVRGLRGVGLYLWQEGLSWYWRLDEMCGGPEASPVLATGAAIARLGRMGSSSSVQEDDPLSANYHGQEEDSYEPWYETDCHWEEQRALHRDDVELAPWMTWTPCRYERGRDGC